MITVDTTSPSFDSKRAGSWTIIFMRAAMGHAFIFSILVSFIGYILSPQTKFNFLNYMRLSARNRRNFLLADNHPIIHLIQVFSRLAFVVLIAFYFLIFRRASIAVHGR